MRNVVEIPGKGTTTVTTGGVGLAEKATFELGHLGAEDPAGKNGRYGYVREINVRFAGNLKNTNASSRTIEWEKSQDWLRRVVLNAGGHLFFDLPDQGGSSLAAIGFITTGKQPVNNSDFVVPGSGTNGGILAVDLVSTLRFYDMRRREPEDLMIPIKLLRKALLELETCDSGEFGADVSIDSGTFIVTAELVERDEYRAPALYTWAEKKLSSMDDHLTPAGVLYTDVFLSRNSDDGIAHDPFAAGELGTVLFKIDNDTHADNVDVDDLAILYCNQQAPTSEGHIPMPTLGSARLAPILWMPRSNGKVTKFKYADGEPKIKLGGTADVENFRVLEHFHIEQTLEQFLRNAQRARVRIPRGSRAMAKTHSKVAINPRKAEKAAFLPVKLVPPASDKGE